MKFSRLAILSSLAFAVVGCGLIPGSYQGDYVDGKNNVHLTLTGGNGTVTLPDGRQIKADATKYSPDLILKEKAAIYLQTNQSDSSLTDVYWINPDMSSPEQSDNGVITYPAEIIMFPAMNLSNPPSNKVNDLQISYCKDGRVQLDPQGGVLPQKGCGVDEEYFDVVRKQ